MSIIAFDIGGSAVKYALWEDDNLGEVSQFETPKSFDDLLVQMKSIIVATTKTITGVAISSPGAVNVENRTIDGISAVEYLHDFPIFDVLEKQLGIPVTIENDANCAGIAEMEKGAGKAAKNAVFIVLGTGVGGSIFINRSLYKGSHLFGGEFGLFMGKNNQILSSYGTIVKVATKYSEKSGHVVDGKKLYELANNSDELASSLISNFYNDLAQALYTIQVSLDPELIMIGGGVSAIEEIPREVSKRLLVLLEEQGVSDIMPEISACEFKNDANLIGAVMNFINLNR